MADTLLQEHPMRIIQAPALPPEDYRELAEALAGMGMGDTCVLPPGIEVEYTPPRETFDMLVVEGECVECGARLAAGSLVWMKTAGPWWRCGRSGGWYHEPFPGMRYSACQSCAAGVLLPWHEAQEQERRKARCDAARAAWLDPDGPEVRCECGHLVEEHCLDDEHCTWDPEEELGGRCQVADCDCYVCRPETVFDFAKRQLAGRELVAWGECPTCDGDGRIDYGHLGSPCKECGGQGERYLTSGAQP